MKLAKLLSTAALTATLSVGGAAQAGIIADVLWVIDTSGSMGDDIDQVRLRIQEFNSVMLSNTIDAQYGLVRFGGANTLIQDITNFGNFDRVGGPFRLLAANGGGTEDGSEAMRVGVTSASWRNDAVRNIILVTDEDDDNTANRGALQAAIDATAIRELINIIGNPNDDFGSYYRTLAPANGGMFFNILEFRTNPGPFFTSFVQTKVTEIVSDFCTRFPNDPACRQTVPEPGVLALVGLGLLGIAASRRRRVVG